MAKKEQVPAIRFQGFADPWEQRKFSDMAETRRGLTYSPSSIRVSGIRVLRSSNIAEDQFAYSEDDVFVAPDAVKIPFANQGDILITSANGSTRLVGKHTIIRDIPMNSAVHGGFMLLATAQNPEFVNALMSAPWYAKFISLFVAGGNGAIGNLNKNDLDEQDVLVPEDAEQRIIGQYFSQLDRLITLHQRKYDKLVAIKRSMLEKMFPREGSRFPEIRFAGFTDPWEQRKLSEVFSSYTDPVDIPHDGYERLGIRSHAKGTFHSYVPAGHELQTAQMHRVAANKFIVNITFGWEHAVAVTDENDAGKLVSHRFPQFSLSDELDPQFLKFIILDERFRHHLWLASPGGAGRNRVLNLNQMLQYEIQIPCVAEQRKIAGALINIDILITLHQRKLEKLQAIKRSMLEKMFV